ncbi:ABC transporter permease [Pseudonocardia sp. TRM90224]|uniref:ABC transporter permease n=1 Tax=Pseudonocardia sp. TRM90224 TaxID=2812678 RepID=UPI001E2C40E9|nr:ABC transporter permease [Pseudonocardia sp. TRM90224]
MCAGFAGCILLGLVALLGPVFLDDPNSQDLEHNYAPPIWAAGGSSAHLLGTDELGRDLLARVATGLRISFEVGLLATALAAALGVTLGIVAGWRGGWLEQVIMRVIDIQFTIPGLVLIILLAALTRPDVLGTSVILAVAAWLYFARILQPVVVALRGSEFVQALTATGVPRSRIIVRHVVPNLASLILSLTVLTFATTLVAEAALGYLGLGIPPPTATLGSLLNAGQTALTAGHSWLLILPAAVLTLLLAAVGVIGNWIDEQLDPRTSAAQTPAGTRHKRTRTKYRTHPSRTETSDA